MGWVAIAVLGLATQEYTDSADTAALHDCSGALMRGGAVACRGIPRSTVRIGEAQTTIGTDGWVVIGFDRDGGARETALVELPDGRRLSHEFQIAARKFGISRINGLPPEQVNRYTPRQLARINDSSRRKEAGDRSREPLSAFRFGFVSPVDGRKTSDYGTQRILNGVAKRPHYGVDLAAPVGTPIRAPAAAIVTLADDDLYFEGAMIVLDHGQGFLSKYLHVSRMDVAVGDRVERGQVIGAVGSRGRSTGPHLCWRLKWRDRNLDPGLWLEAAISPVD
jgi:murein DD-endopeptidase MepM/ murein hydrolase activator NlpD